MRSGSESGTAQQLKPSGEDLDRDRDALRIEDRIGTRDRDRRSGTGANPPDRNITAMRAM
eukprot:13928879-Alexandrium_andersonii.AAC.1